ncbi:YihY/virulence factor BrkB family protein [Microvirga antarctica]|uniref:YihY/virulence factor BrkB family protein n=1 Tax=Microvirga antarctica TaxID=2819233 RepID=UPI001B311B40|nr:YihY/virulence factor BrkB family protein [Microvirga antarctica]
MTIDATERGEGDPGSRSLIGTVGSALVGLAILKLVGRASPAAVPRMPPHGDEHPGNDPVDRGFSEKEHAPVDVAEKEHGRGRRARSPQHIPLKGWKDILLRTYEEFGQDRVMSVAAGVTYYALLAIFPAVAAFVSLYGLFADTTTIHEHLNVLAGVLPGGALEIIGEQVKRISSKGSGTLGVSFVISLAIALWSANAGMKAIFDALNIVYDEEEKRSFIKLNALSLSFTAGAIAFLAVAVGAIVVLPIILGYIGLGSGLEWLLSLARWPILLICVVIGLAVLYRYGPSRDSAKWRWVTPGGLGAAFLWLLVSVLFSWYVASFGSYNETYGSLGAVIGFMTWIWASAIVILLGAEINAETEHQTLEDTTRGPTMPMGSRGAQMADTVGVSKAS